MSTRPDPERSGAAEIATRTCPRLRVAWDLREHPLKKKGDGAFPPDSVQLRSTLPVRASVLICSVFVYQLFSERLLGKHQHTLLPVPLVQITGQQPEYQRISPRFFTELILVQVPAKLVTPSPLSYNTALWPIRAPTCPHDLSNPSRECNTYEHATYTSVSDTLECGVA